MTIEKKNIEQAQNERKVEDRGLRRGRTAQPTEVTVVIEQHALRRTLPPRDAREEDGVAADDDGAEGHRVGRPRRASAPGSAARTAPRGGAGVRPDLRAAHAVGPLPRGGGVAGAGNRAVRASGPESGVVGAALR